MAAETAQRLRGLPSLADNPGLVPSIQAVASVTPVPGELSPFSVSIGTAHIHADTQTHNATKYFLNAS